MDRDDIPRESIAAMRAFFPERSIGSSRLRAAFLAGIKAWPEMSVLPASVQHQLALGYEIILPIPKEVANARSTD